MIESNIMTFRYIGLPYRTVCFASGQYRVYLCLSVCRIFVCLPVSVYLYLSIFLFVHLSIYVCMYDSSHPNVFVFILCLSKVRESEACKPSKNCAFFFGHALPLPSKLLLLMTLFLRLLFYCSFLPAFST